MAKKDREQQQDSSASSETAQSREQENKEFEDLQRQLEQANESLMRLKAEFANYQKRTEQEKREIYDRAKGDVFSSLVNVFDDFELALSHDQDGENFRKGIELVYAKLYQMAEEKGLKRIETVGSQFDPKRHEAMLAEKSDKPSQEIIEELQPGYEVDGRVVRTAKVKVSQ